MITFPNAKINLGLSITSKRPDGYHNLETVFYPLPIEDVLEVTPMPEQENPCTLHLSGSMLEGNPDENLVVRAYQLLRKTHSLPPITIHLHKHIPSGAGLGGGSADAAFTLRLLNNLFQIGLDTTQLEDLATQLGADCPFFIQNQPVYAEGIGNQFTPINLSLRGYPFLLVKPNIFVSTRAAFSQVHPEKPVRSVRDIIQLPIAEWRKYLKNDFEMSVFPQFPAIEEIKNTLYSYGAAYASMSGSGSSVYAIFEPGSTLPDITFSPDTFVHAGVLA